MKTLKSIFLFILTTFFTIISFSQKSNSAITESIEKFNKEYVAMFLKQNFELVQKKYSDSVRLMPEFQNTILTKENTGSYYKSFFNRFEIKSYSRETFELLNLENRIVEIGNFNLVMNDSEDHYELKGKYLNIWALNSEDSLVLITEAWNYDHGVNFADKLRLNEVPSIRMALEPHLPIRDNISFELAGLNALMESIISSKDGKLWSRFYADKGASLHSFTPMISGRNELNAYFEKHAKELPIFEKLDVRTDKIDELDGYVIEYATAIANWRLENVSGVSTSKNIRLWKREPNGSLKIYRMIAMYD